MLLERQVSARNSPAAGGRDNRVDGSTACTERSVSGRNFSTSARLLEGQVYAIPTCEGTSHDVPSASVTGAWLEIRMYVVFDNEVLGERLKRSGRSRPLAELSMVPRATPPAPVAAFEVHVRGAGR